MSLRSITPTEAKRLVDQGAILVDIRESAELAQAKIPGARHMPLSQLEQARLPDSHSSPVIFLCRSGARTMNSAPRLAGKLPQGCEGYVLAGGIDAWHRAGLPVQSGR